MIPSGSSATSGTASSLTWRGGWGSKAESPSMSWNNTHMDAKVELRGGYVTVHKEACCLTRQVRAELHQRLPLGPYICGWDLHIFLPRRPNCPESNTPNTNSIRRKTYIINIT